MKEVKANLKAMAQWPAVWCFYGLFGLIELCLASSACENLSNDSSGFVGAWWVLSSLILGVSISAIQMSIVGKTLAFMLPGHERGVRQVLLGTGPIVIGIFSLVFLYYPDLSQAAYVGLYLSAFCLGMFCYWLGVAVVLIWGMKYVAILFIFGVIVFSVGRWIELFIVKLPILSIGLGTAATGGFWWLLNQPEFFKHYCRQTWYQSSAIAISEKRQPSFGKTNPIPARQRWLETIADRFFLERMRACKSGGMARYLWGQLYEMLGPKIIRWKPIWDFLGYLLLFLVFGYTIIETHDGLILFPWIVFPFMLLGTLEHIHSSPLIIGGRGEGFRRS